MLAKRTFPIQTGIQIECLIGLFSDVRLADIIRTSLQKSQSIGIIFGIVTIGLYLIVIRR